MSVRRLAEDHVQPTSFAFSQENASWVESTILKYPEGRQQSAVIPLMMRAQEQEGWVTKAAIEAIADMLGMPYIRALEVATFYTQFQLKPVGTQAHVQICGTTPCMLRGSEDLIRLCKSRIHPEPFALNDNGTLSWEEVECQGACVNAPMVMIFKDAYEDLTPDQLADIIDRFEAGEGASVTPGPQNGRHLSAPTGGLTSLTDLAAADRKADEVKAKRKSVPTAPKDAAGGTTPTEAAKPKTTAPEADPTIKSPKTAKGPLDEKTVAAKDAKPEGDGDNTLSKTEETHDAPQAEARRVKPAPARTEKAKAASADTAVDQPVPATSNAAAKPAARATGASSASDRNRPAAAEKPAAPDDLKLISGVGPKIEATLNGLGVWTYAQIAGWKKAEREWVDDHLRFAGRIERDDWVRQAKALAKGGEAEYIRVFGKKPR